LSTEKPSQPDPTSPTAIAIAWFKRKWGDLAGAKKVTVEQQGELGQKHLDTRRGQLGSVPGRERSPAYLDSEFREVSDELR
jgi:hypothetical protein